MRVAVLATHPELAPSTRFRVAQYRSFLAEEGIVLSYSFLFSQEEYRAIRAKGSAAMTAARLFRALERRRRWLNAGVDVDVLWIEREIAPAFSRQFRGSLDRVNVPIIFDFDDALFLPKPGGNPLVRRFSSPRDQTADLCSRAHTVLAGNEYLADFARPFAQRVRILPTVIDTDRFKPGPARTENGGGAGADIPVIGWVGSHTTLPYLLERAEAFRLLAKQRRFRLRIVSNAPPPRIPGVFVEYVPWTPETEVSVFHGLSVGVYPLEDNEWAQGKCGFKAIEYLACGIPVVASPVGVIRDIVLPEETGLWATSDQEWCDAMKTLLDTPETAARWGAVGRALVVDRYSIRAAIPILVEALRDTAVSGGFRADWETEGSPCAASSVS